MLGRLFPDLIGVVSEILFEHSPGRGNLAFTGDGTAFDVLVRAKTPTGRSAFLAVEVKYTEAPGGTSIGPNGRYDELSREASIFRDPVASALRGGTLSQLWRQHLLATAMLQRGLYEEGRVLIMASLPNRQLCGAVAHYASHLISPDPAEVRFGALALERFITVLAEVGADPTAERLADRYLDFRPVNEALEGMLAG